MSSHPPYLWMHVRRVGEAAVVKFTLQRLVKEGTIESIGEQLYDLVDAHHFYQIVVDFSNVERLTSAMTAKLIVLHRKAQAAGGRLVLCGIDPGLHETFETLKLTKLFHICGQEQEALQSL